MTPHFEKHTLIVEQLDGKYYIYPSIDPWESWDLIPKYGECKIWYICNGGVDEDNSCDFLSYWSVF